MVGGIIYLGSSFSHFSVSVTLVVKTVTQFDINILMYIKLRQEIKSAN